VSNEIAHRKERPPVKAGAGIAALVPQNLEEVFRLAGAVHASHMAPFQLDSPEKITIAIMAGLEIGLPPMQAIQSVAIINNRPCVWGDALVGVVRSSPLCLYVREWMEGEGDSLVAVCETHRRGEPEPVQRRFSAFDAKRARLWQTKERVQKRGKNGSTYEADNDSPWFRYPQRMLQMRARAWCLRDVYPDVLKGIQVREEVEDYAPASAPPEMPARVRLEERLAPTRQIEAKPTSGFDPDFVAAELAGQTDLEVMIAETTRRLEDDPEPASDAITGHLDEEPPFPGPAEPAEWPSFDPAGEDAPKHENALAAFSVALDRTRNEAEAMALMRERGKALGAEGAESLRAAKVAYSARLKELERGSGR
jgi:hypothetical protein